MWVGVVEEKGLATRQKTQDVVLGRFLAKGVYRAWLQALEEPNTQRDRSDLIREKGGTQRGGSEGLATPTELARAGMRTGMPGIAVSSDHR